MRNLLLFLPLLFAGCDPEKDSDNHTDLPIGISNKGGIVVPIDNNIGINPANGKLQIQVAPQFYIEP